MRPIQGLRAAAAIASVTGALAASNSSTAALLSDGYLNLGNAEAAYAKAKAFVAGLSNADKVALITNQGIYGNVTWNALNTTDGAAGINQVFYVSAFSEPSALTMSWNRDLIQEQFRAMGDEFYGIGYQLIDGPVSSPLGRIPESGRVPEGFSPEPYLNGISLGLAVKGMNGAGVITGARHFLFYEQETNRTSTERYSANVDDKTTQEVYAWPFADGIKNGLMAVMCSMNKANGTQTCENNKLISGYLKTDLGFPGLVFPDVESQTTSFGSANAGLDYGSSQYWSDTIIEAGIANGSLTQARLDDMAIRNVIGYYYVGLDKADQPSKAGNTEYRNVRGKHGKLIRRSAAESIVLLKNSNTTSLGLPLNKPKTMSLYGAHAGPVMAGPNTAFSVQGTPSDTYQGHLATSGGAGQASFPYLITPHTALTVRAAEEGSMIWWVLNNTYTDTTSSSSSGMGGGFGGAAPGGNSTDSSNSTAGGGAAAGAGGGGNLGNLGSGTAVSPSIENYASDNSEVCLVFINANSGEGADRTELSNDEQDSLVNTVADNCNNTIVVVNTVGPRLLDNFITHENVTAVLYSGLLGQESGNAITDVLYGDVNPSAKLTYTIAKNASDYPASVCYTAECDFSEGMYIDYRWFNKQNITARYAFGHGLSYTTFEYGDVSVNKNGNLTAGFAIGRIGLGGQEDLWDEVITVSTSISNSGSRDGAEVAQLYVSFPDEAEQPVKVLRGFEKKTIAKGQNVDVQFSVRRRDVSYWDVVGQGWKVASGKYTFSVGASSDDIRGTAELTI